jgi:hypothetical protein
VACEAAFFEGASSFMVHSGQLRDFWVEIVVDFDVVLFLLGVAHDSADLLDDVSFERDGADQEDRVEAGCVEAFAGEFVDGQQHEWFGVVLIESRAHGAAFGRGHSSVQEEWSDAVRFERCAELT